MDISFIENMDEMGGNRLSIEIESPGEKFDLRFDSLD